MYIQYLQFGFHITCLLCKTKTKIKKIIMHTLSHSLSLSLCGSEYNSITLKYKLQNTIQLCFIQYTVGLSNKIQPILNNY